MAAGMRASANMAPVCRLGYDLDTDVTHPSRQHILNKHGAVATLAATGVGCHTAHGTHLSCCGRQQRLAANWLLLTTL